MALRQGSRGAFLGCTGYPKCRNALPVDDQGQPVPPVKVEVACTKCGGPMAVRRGRRGSFLGCLNYPKCRGTAPIPDDLKDQLAEQAAAAGPSPAADLKCDRRRGDLRAVRRSHARPPQPPRLLPGLRPVSPVQGDAPARRGHARQDQRGHEGLNRQIADRGRTRSSRGAIDRKVDSMSFVVTSLSRAAGLGAGAGRPTAMA